MKKNLKKLLKKSDIIDIIVFGSFLKQKEKVSDIDIAVIIKEISLDLPEEFDKKIHVTQIRVSDILNTALILSLLCEGYSIKQDAYLRDIHDIKPMKLYDYNLLNLNKSQKTQFAAALRKLLKRVKGEKVGSGAVLVPYEWTSYFEEFLDVWELKYKTREFRVF